MFSLSWTAWLLLSVFLTQVVILLVTVYFHRACSHRSVVLSDRTNRVCRFLAWFLIAMDPREFAAVHRKHHARCDTPEDPHSPANHQWWGVLLGGLWLYRHEAANPETLDQYGRGLPRDPWEGFYSRFHWLGIVLQAALLVALFGAKGLLLWAVMMLWIPFWAAGVINGLGHHVGYRNYQTDDLSTNLLPWGVWVGGEELHNNHHAFPASARFSRQSWEFDLGWQLIRLLCWLGLARLRQDHTVSSSNEDSTLQAFLRDRHAWLARLHTALDVHLRGVLADHGYSRWRQLSVAHDRLNRLSSRQRVRLDAVLMHPQVAAARSLEQELRRFWSERGRLCHERLDAWRMQARSMGLGALDDFASALPIA